METRMEMKDNTKFLNGLAQFHIKLEEKQLCQFDQYYELLIQWNRVMNLTAITEYEEVITKHFLDSLSIVKAYPDWLGLCKKDGQGTVECREDIQVSGDSTQSISISEEGKKDIQASGEFTQNISTLEQTKKDIEISKKCTDNIFISKEFTNNISVLESNKIYRNNNIKKLLDLGTGAGFPGIPLKIAFPELEITLVDSLNKRVNFLNEVIKQLGLTGICAVHGRAEELGQKENYREQYDYCVSRAVAKLHLLAEYCIPFIKQNGYFISYKSGKVDEEIKEATYAIQKLGGKYKNTISFLLPDSDIERSLIVIGKQKKTEKQYPRNAGKIAKKPLLV